MCTNPRGLAVSTALAGPKAKQYLCCLRRRYDGYNMEVVGETVMVNIKVGLAGRREQTPEARLGVGAAQTGASTLTHPLARPP